MTGGSSSRSLRQAVPGRWYSSLLQSASAAWSAASACWSQPAKRAERVLGRRIEKREVGRLGVSLGTVGAF